MTANDSAPPNDVFGLTYNQTLQPHERVRLSRGLFNQAFGETCSKQRQMELLATLFHEAIHWNNSVAGEEEVLPREIEFIDKMIEGIEGGRCELSDEDKEEYLKGLR